MNDSGRQRAPSPGTSRGARVLTAPFGQGERPLEIDALAMRAVRRRFMAINQDRLRRVSEALASRQQLFLRLLPLLFHINHPMLPGYVSAHTPCGISGYVPGKRCIQAARRLARSFSYQRRAQKRYSIHGLYLMGSTGTIAYSRSSDFDIWICHRPGLADKEIAALQQKAEGVRTWAESLGLETHFFLMDDASFRAREHRQLSNESAGSTQHHLLLDEFYRTGLLVAGRYPVWWLVPPEYESRYEEYVDRLIVNRFIKSGDIVDFGGLSGLPAEEFYSATLWQLYKAVESPYKSILKILLMEAYANQYPQVELLAMRFKRMVHEADVQLDQLDPYVMMYNQVEEYLFGRRELERLDLARRCFYFKVNEAMSRPDPANSGWRREAVRELVERWGWSRTRLEELDHRDQWKIRRVLQERRQLVDELTCSYRALSRFGRENESNNSLNPDDLNLLGRKLYVAFERKAGKVERINPGISRDLSEERLSLHHVQEDGRQGWVLYRGAVTEAETAEHDALKRASSLLQLLAWCHFNGLVNRNPSSISIHPVDTCLTQWELRGVLDCLQQLFPGGQVPAADIQALNEPAHLLRAGLFINLAQDPMSKLTRNGMQLVSERIDPLSYGGQWENLAVSFQLIGLSSWGELLTFEYAGGNALLDCLCDYFAWAPIDCGHTPPPLPCFSFSSSRGPIIARRVEELAREIGEFFYHNYWRRHARYALRIGQRYFLLQSENKVPRYREFDTDSALTQALGEPQAGFSPIRMDAQLLDDSPLSAALALNREGVVQLFYRLDHGQADIWILDERGSLFYQRMPFHDRQTLLGPFQRFLDAVRYRIQHMQQSEALSNEPAEYHRILRDSLGQWISEPQTPAAKSGGYFDVQVIGDPQPDGGGFSIYCNEREFSSLEHGDDLFLTVARHITRLRKSRSRYPVYITDIDLSPTSLDADGSDVQTIHFLRQKKRIEQLLNESLQRLRRKPARN